MIKVIIVILLIFNIVACEPISPASTKSDDQQQVSFVCLISQSRCSVESNYGHFTLHFSQAVQEGKIKTELPFYIQLSFEGLNETYQLKNISAYLEGKSMFMGKIPVFFEKKGINVMVAESLLANCSEEVMTWQL